MKRFLLVATLCLTMAAGYSVVNAAADGKTLYAKCAGCHGADGGKFKSKAEADVLTALKGYKAMNYGGDKKTIMENMVKNLSDEDVATLAKYISTL